MELLVFTKLLGGEFVTTTVEMAPGWPVRLCIVAGLTVVRAYVLVVITLLGYTCTTYCMYM